MNKTSTLRGWLCNYSINFTSFLEDSEKNGKSSLPEIVSNNRNINNFHKKDWKTAYACNGLETKKDFIIKSKNVGEDWTIVKNE